MQPLDRTYFKSLKTSYNAHADSWMISNPGKRISSYEMAALFGKAFLKTATPGKAVHGFETCGLWPFNEDIFSNEDFCAAEVTEETEPTSSNQAPAPLNGADTSTSEGTQSSASSHGPGTSGTQTSASSHGPGSSGIQTSASSHGPGSSGIQSSASSHDPGTSGTQTFASSHGPGTSGTQTSASSHGPGTSGTQSSASSFAIGTSASDAALSTTTMHDTQILTKDIKTIIHSLSPPPKLSTSRPRKRKAESATLLTSSPFKKSLELKQGKQENKSDKGAKGKVTKRNQNRSSSNKKQSLSNREKAKSKKSRPTASAISSDEEEEWPCIICCEAFATSQSGEEWVQCQACLKWAHDACTPGFAAFVCPNCESDSE